MSLKRSRTSNTWQIWNGWTYLLTGSRWWRGWTSWLIWLTWLCTITRLLLLTDYRTVPSWIYSRLVTIWFDLLSRFWLILGGLQRRRLDLSICRCWMFMAILLLSRMAKGIGSMRLIWLPICPTLDTWITFLLTRGRGNRLPIVMRSLGAERTRLNFYRIWRCSKRRSCSSCRRSEKS